MAKLDTCLECGRDVPTGQGCSAEEAKKCIRLVAPSADFQDFVVEDDDTEARELIFAFER